MTDAQQDAWPNRRLEMLVPTTNLCVLSTLVFIWRIIYGNKNKRKLLICDILLAIAAVSQPTLSEL
jgi:multisubunit Na+/H+ antiporter MnhF subunit